MGAAITIVIITIIITIIFANITITNFISIHSVKEVSEIPEELCKPGLIQHNLVWL